MEKEKAQEELLLVLSHPWAGLEWKVTLPVAKVQWDELYEHFQAKPWAECLMWRRAEPGQAPAAGEGGWQPCWGHGGRRQMADGTADTACGLRR